MFQVVDLRKEVDEMKKYFTVDSVSQALREVKEYCTRTTDFNVDTLQLKLMHLDEVARRNQHNDRELFYSALERFLCHKNHPKIGFLISSILSSPAESKILEKEQKVLKVHGKSEKETTKQENAAVNVEKQQNDFTGFMVQMLQSFMPQQRGPRFQAMNSNMRSPGYTRFGYRPRYRPPFAGCFTCGDTSHIRANCPQNK